MTPICVKLGVEDRRRLERLAAESGSAVGRPVTLSDVIRQLVRDAASRTTPVRVARTVQR